MNCFRLMNYEETMLSLIDKICAKDNVSFLALNDYNSNFFFLRKLRSESLNVGD